MSDGGTVQVIVCAQRSPEWLAARIGCLTGSRAGDMLSRLKSGEAAGRRNLRVQLVCERLTNRPQEKGYRSRDMRAGEELEPLGIAAYEAVTGTMVSRVGFVRRLDIQAGCSPDGLIGDDGLLEIKCPLSATHLEYLRADRLPPEYRPQVTHNLWVTNRQWCDFVSYDENFPPPLQLVRVRIPRADLDIDRYQQSAIDFLREVEKELSEVRTLMGMRE